MSSYPGIPSEITLEIAREYTRPRVSKKRFAHIEGVAAVGAKLAKAANSDPFLAELAGLLHDCCKEIKDRELVEMARRFGMTLDPVEESNGHLLHGPVGAKQVEKDLEITNTEFLNAIAEHTLGAVPMTKLSKVVFLADCLEDSRPKAYTQPIWDALETKLPNGAVDLDNAMLVALDSGLTGLIEQRRTIHPKTIDVRNHYLQHILDRKSHSKDLVY